jgi:hypothetical protein
VDRDKGAGYRRLLWSGNRVYRSLVSRFVKRCTTPPTLYPGPSSLWRVLVECEANFLCDTSALVPDLAVCHCVLAIRTIHACKSFCTGAANSATVNRKQRSADKDMPVNAIGLAPTGWPSISLCPRLGISVLDL